MATDVSIIIISWNTREYLRQCLNSLLTATDVAQEILVVDNASTDGSQQMVRDDFSAVRLLENQSNYGFARAVNQATAYSRGRHVLLLNPDTLVTPTSIKLMAGYLDGHPQVGAVGCRQVDEQGRLQWSCGKYPVLHTEFFELALLSKYFPKSRIFGKYLMSYWDHRESREVDWLTGACLMVRKNVAAECQGLDESFFMYGEDVDFCYRIRRRGYGVVYYADACIVHFQGKSSRRVYADMYAQRYRGRLQFFKKHYGRLALHVLRFMIIASFSLRLALRFLTISLGPYAQRQERRQRRDADRAIITMALRFPRDIGKAK